MLHYLIDNSASYFDAGPKCMEITETLYVTERDAWRAWLVARLLPVKQQLAAAEKAARPTARAALRPVRPAGR